MKKDYTTKSQILNEKAKERIIQEMADDVGIEGDEWKQI